MNDSFLLQILGIVALLRKAYPKIDNFYVPLVAIAVGIVLTFAFSFEFPAHSWMAIVQDGVRYALAAVGVTSGIGYASQKMRGASPADPAAPPGTAPAAPTVLPPRVFIDTTMFEQVAAPSSTATATAGAP